MIVTVTMNPALDKTAELHSFEHASLNRLKNVVTDPGGKGINVSKTLASFGVESIATGFLAGNTGRGMEAMLKGQGIKSDFIYVDGETRTNLKVTEPHGVLTEFNEPGPRIDEKAINRLLHKLDSLAKPDTFFVLTGSIPTGLEPTIYATIIQRVKERGAQVLLDADGELLLHAVEAKPNIIKLNRFEMEQYIWQTDSLLQQKQRRCKEEHLSEQQFVECARKLQGKGIDSIVITLGDAGALFIFQDKVLKADGLLMEVHSAVGAGDAMAAALAYSITGRLDDEACIRLSMAASAGAVMTVGTKPPTWEQVQQLEKQVKFARVV